MANSNIEQPLQPQLENGSADVDSETVDTPQESPAEAEKPQPDNTNEAKSERPGRILRVVRRIGTVAAAAGALYLGGAVGHSPEAEASPAHPTTASESESSGTDWGTTIPIGISAATAVVALGALRSNTKEKRRDRYAVASINMGDLNAKSPAQERAARLKDLTHYVDNPARKESMFKEQVFVKITDYLRQRKGPLEDLRKKIEDPTLTEEERAESETLLKKRTSDDELNADRNALKAFTAALPAMRKQFRREKAKHVVRTTLPTSSKQEKLDRRTGLSSGPDKPLIPAKGIWLDYMREVEPVGSAPINFEDIDFTGAGMRDLTLTRVRLAGSRLRESRLEGATMRGCDIRDVDLRAAYFDEDSLIERCVIDKRTKFGNLPDDYPKSKMRNNPDEYRGNPTVVLRDLVPAKGVSEEEMHHIIWGWQEQGLVLLPGSTPDYVHPSKRTPNVPSDSTVESPA
jgi:hypothetical protein